MRTVPTLAALAAAALFSACATREVTPPELLHAREVVRAAQADPRVLQHAPLELKRATDALARADRLGAKGEALDEIGSAAYVAQRQAETAIALAQAKANEDALKSAEADRERMRADARAAEARRAQAEATSARVAATAAQQRADAASLQASDAEARAREASQQAAALQRQLEELAARPTDRGMLVTLGDVLFEFGRAEVKPGARESLRKLADYLQQHPERRILIEGHTDAVGSDTVNLLLSQRRAEAVAVELIALGVAPGRISAQGYGESYPVASNASDSDRALNRRVEVYISEGSQPVRSRG